MMEKSVAIPNMNVSDIVRFITDEKLVLGSTKKQFSGIAPLDNATSMDLTFCNHKDSKAPSHIISSNAGIILCHLTLKNNQHLLATDKTLIMVDNPKLWFIRATRHFFNIHQAYGVHLTADINYECVSIGKRVIIGPNCSIGFDGFGFDKNEEGAYERFPHIGRVIIEDDVEIGGNVCIDRGALGNTVIGRGTKIDNLVHIAHNVKIGVNCIVVALSCIGGSVKIGDGVYIGIGASIRNQVTIGDGAFIGMGAVVVKDVRAGVTVIGNPAREMEKK